MAISFRLMTEGDIPLYKEWAAKEHVRTVWFCEGYQPVDAIYGKVAGNGYDYPYLILLDRRPIGHIVTCDLFAYKSLCPKAKGVFTDEPEGTFSIDLFIGEEDLLNKGYGTEAVRRFSDLLFRERGARRVVIDPDINHSQALRCYEKAGFKPIGKEHDGVMEVLILEKRREVLRPKVSVFIAASLDGYIAQEDGSVEFLNAIEAGDEDCGFREFIDEIDAIVMGRKTYEVTLELTKGEWPHSGRRVIVLSRTLTEVHTQAELFQGTLSRLMDKLEAEKVTHCWIDGGSVISEFLRQGLVDFFTLSIIPVILGGGISLFQRVGKEIPLRLHRSKSYPFGLVQLVYKIENESSGSVHPQG